MFLENPEISLILPGHGDIVVNVSSPVKNWPDITASDGNFEEFKKLLQSISPKDAAGGGHEPLAVSWDDLLYVPSQSSEVYKRRDKRKKLYIVKSKCSNRIIAHFVFERILRLLGIPTTESHIIESNDSKRVIIMPFMEFTDQQWSNPLDDKYIPLVRGMRLVNLACANWDQSDRNARVFNDKPIFFDGDVAFGIDDRLRLGDYKHMISKKNLYSAEENLRRFGFYSSAF